jgi:glycosyltransferase involved in cell wall biosynthesis
MKTKVAFFADILVRDFDGACRTIFHILDRIPKDQFEFLFITGKRPEKDFPFKVLEIPNMKIPFNGNYSMAFPAINYFSIRRKLDTFKPDVIHIASPSLLGNFALDYAESRGLPKVSIYHTHFISYVSYYLHDTPILTQLAEKAVINGQRKFYNRCDLILVPTAAIRNELIGYGFSAEKLVLWQRGLDHVVFNPGKKNRNEIARLMENNHPILLFASRMVWEKNLKILVDLYDLYEKEETRINFLMVGDGVAREEMEKMMPRAKFLGKVGQTQLGQLYASADIFVFPSISETYGNVVVEALACGIPCIVGDGGGSASFINQGINGFKCDPNNPADFKEKIDLVINSPLLRSQMSKAGIKSTASLDWKTLVDKYFKYLKGISEKTYAYV